MVWDIFTILVLIGLNGIFAMAEIALVSVRKARLEQRAQEGDRKAQVALDLSQDPKTLLSTAQFGITLVGTLSSALGGATISRELQALLAPLPLVGPYAELIGLALVVLLITYVSIIIGELVPKTVGIAHAEAIAIALARPMRALARVASPAIRFFKWSTDRVLSALGIRTDVESEVTQDEIKIMIEQGAEAGVLEEEEHEMVERVFRLGDRLITMLMTQRQDVVWIDAHEHTDESLKRMVASNHSYFPLCDGELDRVIGMISIKDVLLKYTNNEKVDLQALVRPPLFIPDNLSALRALSRLKETKTHIAVVLDEYGSLEGVVTLNDFVEAVLGELAQANSEDKPDVVTREDGSWLVDGRYASDELRDLLEVSSLAEEERGDYQTLAGFVMTILGRVPTTGDHFTWGGFRFEVVDMDGNRIDRVMISRLTPPPRGSEIGSSERS